MMWGGGRKSASKPESFAWSLERLSGGQREPGNCPQKIVACFSDVLQHTEGGGGRHEMAENWPRKEHQTKTELKNSSLDRWQEISQRGITSMSYILENSLHQIPGSLSQADILWPQLDPECEKTNRVFSMPKTKNGGTIPSQKIYDPRSQLQILLVEGGGEGLGLPAKWNNYPGHNPPALLRLKPEAGGRDTRNPGSLL